MWWLRKKRNVNVPTDIDEARELRAEQNEQLMQVRRQEPYVQRLTSQLIERRQLNHFGESIQVTFKPRGGRHA